MVLPAVSTTSRGAKRTWALTSDLPESSLESINDDASIDLVLAYIEPPRIAGPDT